MVVGAQRSVILTGSNVVTCTDSNEQLGPYYVVQIPPLTRFDAGRLHAATLEFVLDVDTNADDGYQDETVMLEVYLTSGDIRNDLDMEKLVRPSSMCRNVVVGTNRQIRLDVTAAVKRYLQNPEGNLELAVGSFAGSRRGTFVLRRDVWGPQSVARLVIVYHP